MAKRYFLTPIAKQTVLDVFKYTFDRWGKVQADKYTDRLFKRFDSLADNPKLGISRPDIKQGYYSYYEGKHTIFYLITSGSIEILAILHQSEDANTLKENETVQ